MKRQEVAQPKIDPLCCIPKNILDDLYIEKPITGLDMNEKERSKFTARLSKADAKAKAVDGVIPYYS